MRLPQKGQLITLGALFLQFSPWLLTQTAPYTLSVSVDEVSVTFHVADWHGVPMDDLTVDDVRVLDNGRRPRHIVSFEVGRNLPVRVGMLIDTSRSVLGDLQRNRSIAKRYVDRLFHVQADQDL